MTEQETIRSLQADLAITIRSLGIAQAREKRLREACKAALEDGELYRLSETIKRQMRAAIAPEE